MSIVSLRHQANVPNNGLKCLTSSVSYTSDRRKAELRMDHPARHEEGDVRCNIRNSTQARLIVPHILLVLPVNDVPCFSATIHILKSND